MNCKWKVSFYFYFSFYTIFSDIATLAKNQCDSAIPSGDICDQRILQSNWLKAFLAETQEQEFSQDIPNTKDLYSKIDNNINFYLNAFPAKISDKFCQNKGKILFWGIFEHILLFFA